jgi:AsmA protein
MQQIDPTNAENREAHENPDARLTPRRRVAAHLRRFWLAYACLLILLGLALLPPLININRFQRRITTSIGGSLGRPVHLDRVSMSLFPLPGFTVENLVVDEDPAFGSEPIIRANNVRATLRLSSLWRRRVEFSTISFTEPSVNLVHTLAGKWNIEDVLLQASRIEAAPTAQTSAGSAPRFPYIEATGARLNFKQEQEKLPFSLIDSEFALWSPDPNQWRLRLRARPTRTDTSVSDSGAIELEATLGRGDSLARIPLNLEGQWHDAPLGEASRVLTGRDAGWRGNMAISANIRGTIGESAVTTRLRLIGARRADFVPQQPVSAEVECFATATAIFHSFQDLRCSWPPDAAAGAPTIALTGEIPDIRRIDTASVQLGTSGIPASTLLSWLRVATPGIADDVSASGKLTGSFVYDGASVRRWEGQLTLHDAGLTTAATGAASLLTGNVSLRTAANPVADAHRRFNHAATAPVALALSSNGVALGGPEPATLDGRIDGDGYTLHLAGPTTASQLEELGRAFPSMAPTLTTAISTNRGPAPFRIDLSLAHDWGGPQVWHDASAHQPPIETARKHGKSRLTTP